MVLHDSRGPKGIVLNAAPRLATAGGRPYAGLTEQGAIAGIGNRSGSRASPALRRPTVGHDVLIARQTTRNQELAASAATADDGLPGRPWLQIQILSGVDVKTAGACRCGPPIGEGQVSAGRYIAVGIHVARIERDIVPVRILRKGRTAWRRPHRNVLGVAIERCATNLHVIAARHDNLLRVHRRSVVDIVLYASRVL